MYSEDEIELTSEERAALAALPREMAPSDLLEERVVRALRNRGEFDSPVRGKSSLVLAWRVAAAMALFAGGVATERYLLIDDSARSESVEVPATQVRDAVPRSPQSGARSARTSETAVAEREMWL